MPYLATDIYSNQNPSKQYGYKGQEVDVISDHAGILIVRPKDGSLGFHILKHELSDSPPGKEGPAPAAAQASVEQSPPPGTRRSGRGRPDPSPAPPSSSAQGSLF